MTLYRNSNSGPFPTQRKAVWAQPMAEDPRFPLWDTRLKVPSHLPLPQHHQIRAAAAAPAPSAY